MQKPGDEFEYFFDYMAEMSILTPSIFMWVQCFIGEMTSFKSLFTVTRRENSELVCMGKPYTLRFKEEIISRLESDTELNGTNIRTTYKLS